MVLKLLKIFIIIARATAASAAAKTANGTSDMMANGASMQFPDIMIS